MNRNGSPSSQKIQAVCGKCNNEWMSGLQSAVKPILTKFLEGHWPQLSIEERKTLVAWVAMFVTVLEFADPGTAQIPQQDRTRLMNHLSVPEDGWFISVSRYDDPVQRAGTFNHWGLPSLLRNTETGEAKKNPIQITSFSVGCLAFFCMSAVTPTMFPPRDVSENMWCIWPSLQSQFRPQRVFDWIELEELSNEIPRKFGAVPFYHVLGDEDDDRPFWTQDRDLMLRKELRRRSVAKSEDQVF